MHELKCSHYEVDLIPLTLEIDVTKLSWLLGALPLAMGKLWGWWRCHSLKRRVVGSSVLLGIHQPVAVLEWILNNGFSAECIQDQIPSLMLEP